MGDDLGALKNKVTSVIDQASSFNPKDFEKRLQQIHLLDDLERMTSLPRTVIVGGIILSFLILTLISIQVRFLGVFVTNFLGYAYPLYRSLLAIESETKVDDTLWLTYWTVFGSFFMFETIFFRNKSVFATGTGLYFVSKILVLGWCQFLNGSEVVYKLALKPMFEQSLQYKKGLDNWLLQFEEYRKNELPHKARRVSVASSKS